MLTSPQRPEHTIVRDSFPHGSSNQSWLPASVSNHFLWLTIVFEQEGPLEKGRVRGEVNQRLPLNLRKPSSLKPQLLRKAVFKKQLLGRLGGFI